MISNSAASEGRYAFDSIHIRAKRGELHETRVAARRLPPAARCSPRPPSAAAPGHADRMSRLSRIRPRSVFSVMMMRADRRADPRASSSPAARGRSRAHTSSRARASYYRPACRARSWAVDVAWETGPEAGGDATAWSSDGRWQIVRRQIEIRPICRGSMRWAPCRRLPRR